MSRLRRSAAVLGPLVAMLLVAPGAVAAPAPRCYETEVTARPDVDRKYTIWCEHTVSVEVASGPSRGALSDVGFVDFSYVTWRFRPDADATGPDEIVLRLTSGAGETADVRFGIDVIPREENTAPECDPVSIARRTDGSAQVKVDFQVMCRDPEGDTMTVDGLGPGAHLSTPLFFPGAWHPQVGTLEYRTAITAGQELATYSATDVLGARSAEAPISITIGPHVDRRPECHLTYQRGGPVENGVYFRAGATRNFGVLCSDADGDAIEPRVVKAPTRGSLTRFALGATSFPQWYGVQRMIDVTYTPSTAWGDGTDAFSLVAAGPHGDGETTPLAMVPEPEDRNGGSACGYDGVVNTTPTGYADFFITCSDGEGDPIVAEVVTPPRHGTTSDPVIDPPVHGGQRVKVPYQAEDGYEGKDYFEVMVGDGSESDYPTLVEVNVGKDYGTPAYLMGPAPWWHLVRPQPPAEATDEPSVSGQPPAVAPVAQARRLLGTKRVRLLRSLGDARLYARSTTLRVRGPSRRALALTCALRCKAVVDARLERPGLARQSSARRLGRQRVSARPGRGAAIRLPLTSRERRAVAAGATRAVFRVATTTRGKRRSGTVALRVRPR